MKPYFLKKIFLIINLMLFITNVSFSTDQTYSNYTITSNIESDYNNVTFTGTSNVPSSASVVIEANTEIDFQNGFSTAAGCTMTALITPTTITSISPVSGLVAGGTSVTITGTNFVGASVTFGGVAATVTTSGTTTMIVSTPAHVYGSVDVVVSTPAGTTTLAGGYMYYYSTTEYNFVTLAGSYPTPAYGYTDATGSSARFHNPRGIAVRNGSLYVADTSNNVIRKVVISTGVVSTYAGSPIGTSGSNNGASLTSAEFNAPTGLAFDSSGNLFVADYNNQTIREISSDGTSVSTFAGTAGDQGYDDGTGSSARFFYPYCLTIDGSNNIYVGQYQTGARNIRLVTPAAVVTHWAGYDEGAGGSDNGLGTAATFDSINGLANCIISGTLNVFISDFCYIRQAQPDGSYGNVTGPFAGYPYATIDEAGSGSSAEFAQSYGLVSDGNGNLIVEDVTSIRQVELASPQTVTTVGGALSDSGGTGPGTKGGLADGMGSSAKFLDPQGITIDGNGVLYISDTGNHVIRIGYPPYLGP